MLPLIESRRSEIAEICRRHHVRRLELFGSSARGDDFDPDRSDVDFVVEFQPDHTPPSLSDIFALKEDLAAKLARPVDLIMETAIRNPYIRRDIERSKEAVFAACGSPASSNAFS